MNEQKTGSMVFFFRRQRLWVTCKILAMFRDQHLSAVVGALATHVKPM